MSDLPLRCACGTVRGLASGITPAAGTHAVCYCSDCQEFARWLGRADILDAHGGTEVFQMPQAKVSITEGAEKIGCLRLTDKGLHRWYATCCRTPIGNTLKAGMPSVGLIHNFIAPDPARDAVLGPLIAWGNTGHALGTLPEPIRRRGFPRSVMLRAIAKFASWKLRGLYQPSPFFDAAGRPAAAPEVLHPGKSR